MRRHAALCLASWLCVVGSLSALGCEARDQSPLGRGGRTFQRSCSGCHGADGRGVHRLGLVKPPRDLTQAEFHAQISDEQLRQVIRVGKGQMPAFGGLMADEDLSNVIAFIRSLPPQQNLAPAGSEAAAAAGGLGMATTLAESLGAAPK
jgi:mono/diheme cytochrome c family protein